MPTPYTEFVPWLHLVGVRERLLTIKPEDGYNTRPHLILAKWPGVNAVPRGDLPALFVHPTIWERDERNQASGRIRHRFALNVYGVAEDDDDPEAVAMALLADVIAAVYEDERATGKGKGLDYRLGTVVWDSEATDNRAGFRAPFESLMDLKRSANP